jgi:ribosome maturation factor RimP
MQLSENISNQLIGLIEPLAENSGLELIEIGVKQANRKKILEIIIDKDGGISLDDCSALSQQISMVLDVEDIIPFPYDLEVGSPGIFRVLKSEKEISKNIDARVKVEFKAPVKGRKRFIGQLKMIDNQMVSIINDQKEISINLEQIKKIQLHPKI